MAGLAIEALSDASLIANAKADLKARTEATPYVSPMPAEVKPLLQPRPAS
jgi:aminobenzoyl-glutamate utilization protein B